MSKTAPASSNWESLKKKINTSSEPKSKGANGSAPPKKRKNKGFGGIGHFAKQLESEPSKEAGPSRTQTAPEPKAEVIFLPAPSDKPLLQELRTMVAGQSVLNEAKKAPGNYIAVDCEMVGLGHLGSESALARVSLVNYHGHVLLDTFVQPRERVTDWRTWVSGVRETDIQDAPPFEEVQKKVAELVEGRILIGHAIENDMKALLLSHPNPFVRDTQKCKQLREAAKTKRPGLKKLVELELGLKIQAGSHSSVTDARATMALYRLHKPEWEASLRKVMEAYREKTGMEPLAKGKRKRGADDGEDDDEDEQDGKKKKTPQQFPGGGRKGISSGLSVVVRRFGKKVEGDQPKRRGPAEAPKAKAAGNWWEEAA
ncbi:RNA exonuclease 4 [Vanrija pseudolonga]|uniref:RNA exonuclease 4 n=1 Tax=Vanrija pseudolonga TaxID=143232 RepID=A0AAF0YGY2_9TREE|nr:RNA exonuclease 4 [Vanrija pseudolonga]